MKFYRYHLVIVLLYSIVQCSLSQNVTMIYEEVTEVATAEADEMDELPSMSAVEPSSDDDVKDIQPISSWIDKIETKSVGDESAIGGYLITTSPVWVSNTRETVCVSHLEGPTQIDFTLKNTYTWNNAFSTTHSQSFPEGGSSCFKIQVPDISISYSTSATLTAHIVTATAIVKKEMRIRMYGEQLETYIQTDKPKYKPGQEVKFRMLSILSPSMKVVKDNISIVWIEAPNGLRIMQWEDVIGDQGLIDLQMQLSDEPMLGTWAIKARVQGKTVIQNFIVEEYVLPKFEVVTETPSAIYIRDESFKIKICGLYTYGQPVRGSVNATVCFKYSWTDCDPETSVVKYTEDTGPDGCGEFELTSEKLKWDVSQYYYGGRQLYVDANFTEAGTDITLNGSSVSTSIKNSAVRIEVLGLNYFKPGFEYNGKVIVTNANNTPANGINLTIAIRENYDSEDIQVFNLVSDNGVAIFSFEGPTDTSVASLYIKVTAEGYETDSTYDDFYGFYRIAYNPYNAKYLTGFYSPSGSFLSIKPIQSELNFGTVHTFDVDYTVPTGDNGNISINYLVLARGAVATSGSLEVPTPSCYRKEKRDIVPATFDYNTYENLPPKPDGEELVIGLEPLPPNCRFSFNLPIEITPEMSPNAKVVIYYVRADDEVISDSIEIQVVKGLSNQVALDFEDDETRPGETTTLTVESEANSLCAVGIVDKSVELLGSTNQLTTDKVFNSLYRYSYGYFYYPLKKCTRRLFDDVRPSPDEAVSNPLPTAKGYTLTTSTYTRTKHADTVTVFQNAGVAFATNLDVETRPCYEITNYYWQRDYPVYYFNKGGLPGAPGPVDSEIVAEDNIAVARGGEAGEAGQDEVVPDVPPVKIRTYFPETLLWQIKRTHKEDGIAKFDLNVPDTITDWKANGFCISQDGDLGISETATLRAFKPFFVSLTLPYSVIRNETVPVKITVFNYLSDKCLMVKLVLQSSNNFTILGGDVTRKVCVCGGSSKTVQFRIVPHQLGDVPITVTAVTKGFNVATSSKYCDGTPEAADRKYVGLSDGVQRDLLVEAEGIETDVTQSSIICLSNGETETSSYMVDLPHNTVPGSARVKLQVIGDIMGPALNNLDRLIRLPTGCGEQNIVKMAPNIYVLQYLINTGQANAELKQNIIHNIQTGYQRELNYRRSDGSYSAFGEHDQDGSTWLTAFVVRSFAESKAFIKVDEDLMTGSLRWLIDQQNRTTGCVMSTGRLFNKAMKGGVSDEITLTAYTMITMLEAGGGQTTDRAISQATKCLVTRWNKIDSGIRNDSYSVALLAYAFKLSGNTLYSDVLNQLNALAIEENGLKHWERPESLRPKNTCFYCRAPSAEVEMTAYALLALDLNTDANQVEGLKISRWLAQQQNAYGGYSSTQDTVIALKALSYFAEVLYGGETTQMNIKASSSADGEVNEFVIDSSNRLLLQRMDIEKAPTTVDIDASGSGCALVQVQALYNIYEKPAVEQEPFSISVDTSTPDEKLGCEKQTMRITISYNGDDGASSMAIAEVKLVSGYYADKQSLYRLSKDADLRKLGFKRYEVSGNMVAFYFDEFTSKPLSFEFDVEQVIKVKNAKQGTITVYDYYEAELKSVISYKPC
ncbi:pregnancy zone protein-like [Anneissia japonica]|uniref:pregnancy zone protein-like n=1 Tax=Anneissia japonica TaxID=1529436 RepID=UPI0014256DA1|nr:pregnancy zone protein-like [Anneissia japonica]